MIEKFFMKKIERGFGVQLRIDMNEIMK